MHGQSEAFTQLLCKLLHFLGLGSGGAAHPQRITDHDFRHLVLPDNGFQLAKVEPLVLAPDGVQPLGGNTQRIRNRQADGFRPNIQSKNAATLLATGCRVWVGNHLAIICLTNMTKFR